MEMTERNLISEAASRLGKLGASLGGKTSKRKLTDEDKLKLADARRAAIARKKGVAA